MNHSTSELGCTHGNDHARVYSGLVSDMAPPIAHWICSRCFIKGSNDIGTRVKPVPAAEYPESNDEEYARLTQLHTDLLEAREQIAKPWPNGVTIVGYEKDQDKNDL